MPRTDDDYGKAITPRLAALERVFGKHAEYLVSPVPFYLGGDTTKVGFEDSHKGSVVYCTSEMTGWDSGQQAGPNGNYELAIVVPKDSPLRPSRKDGQVFTKGWMGVLLDALARLSTQARLVGGELAGPIEPAFAPMSYVLFVDLTNPKLPFEFGGESYGLLLCLLITESERKFVAEHGSDQLLKRLRAAKLFPVSSTTRRAVV